MKSGLHIPWFGMLLAATTILLAAATQRHEGLHADLQRHLALDWDALEDFQFYRIALSPFVQTSPGFSPTVLGLTTLAVPMYEIRDGTRRAIALFFAGDWMSTLPILVALQVAGWLGNTTASRLASTPDSGSSSGGFACMAALIASLPLVLRLLGLASLGGFFVIRLAFWHRLYDFQHALAALIGLAVFTAWDHRRFTLRRASSLVSGTPKA